MAINSVIHFANVSVLRNPVKIHFLSISVCRVYSPVAVRVQHLLLPFYSPVTFKLLVVAEKCWITLRAF